VKLLLLAFSTTYFAEQIFCQILHTRNEYCNRFDMNKTGVRRNLWLAKFLTSHHVRMHRVIFYISNTVTNLII